jgi:hypothetical protein
VVIGKISKAILMLDGWPHLPQCSFTEQHEEAAMTEGKINSDIDIAWGAEAIGAVLGANKRRAHYLLTTGALRPAGAKQVGGRWVASKSRLKAFIEGAPADA